MPSPDPSQSLPAARRRGWIGAVLGLVLLDLAKHAMLLGAGLGQPWSDSVGYWRLGTDVADGDPWMLRTAWGYRTPGYPWFLGGLIGLLGEGRGFLAAILIQHVAVLATDWLVGWWTFRLTGSKGAALAAGAWMVLSTARPFYANWLLTETLATLLLIAAAFLLWSAGREGHGPFPLTMGAIATGLGILIRPSLVTLVPLALGVAMTDAWQSRQPRGRKLLRVLLPVAILAGLLVPWCGRNAHLFGRWTLLTFTGRELWTANFSPWPGANLLVPDDGPGEELRRRVSDFPAIDLRHNASVAGALTRSGLSDAEADRLMERTAWLAIRRDPGRSAVHDLARVGTFWYCKEYAPPAPLDGPPFQTLVPPERPARSELASRILAAAPERTFLFTWTWSALAALGTIGCLLAPPLRRAGLILGFLLAATTILTAVLEIPLYRYRLPLEPLTVVAMVGAGAGWFFPRPGAAVGQDKSSPVR